MSRSSSSIGWQGFWPWKRRSSPPWGRGLHFQERGAPRTEVLTDDLPARVRRHEPGVELVQGFMSLTYVDERVQLPVFFPGAELVPAAAFAHPALVGITLHDEQVRAERQENSVLPRNLPLEDLQHHPEPLRILWGREHLVNRVEVDRPIDQLFDLFLFVGHRFFPPSLLR